MGLTCCAGDRMLDVASTDIYNENNLALKRPSMAIYSPMRDPYENDEYEVGCADIDNFQLNWKQYITKNRHSVPYLIASYADKKLFALVFSKLVGVTLRQGFGESVIMKKYVSMTKEVKSFCKNLTEFIKYIVM